MGEKENVLFAESRYGLALPARRKRISELTEDAKQTATAQHRIENFKGNVVSLPIIRMEINLPKYRIANGRTSSAQQEWITLHNLTEGFFSDGDPELYKIQEAQHKILSGMVGEEGLYEKFKDVSNRQVEPLLLNEAGFVVNGNRRLCCWRTLFHGDSSKYTHFSHVDVVVLPRCEDKELDALEARLQIEREIRSDYSWHAEANMLGEKQKLYGYTTTELAKLYGKSKKEVEELFEIRELGSDYLESRGKKNIWSLLSETEHTFKRLNKTMKEQATPADKEVLKQLAFTYIDDPDAAGERLYTFIPKMGKNLPKLKEKLKIRFPDQDSAPLDSDAASAFGNVGKTVETSGDMNLVAQINDSSANLAAAQDLIVDTLEGEKEKTREKTASKFLLDHVQKSQTALTQAVNLGLIPGANTDGVEVQLSALEEKIELIRNFIKQRNS